MDKDKKSKSRIAMKFSFNNERVTDNGGDVRCCYQEQNNIRISKDLLITTNHLKSSGKTGDDVKYCAKDPQQISVTKGFVIQSDTLNNFDDDSCDLNESFLIPFHQTEDFLIGQEESVGSFSSSRDDDDPSVTSKELVSHSEFLNIDDNTNSETLHDGDSMSDLIDSHGKVNRHAEEDDTDEVGVIDQDQSQSDVQSISTIVELTYALSSNLDSEDIEVLIEGNNADDFQNNACNNKDSVDNSSEVEHFDDNNNNDCNDSSIVDGGQTQLSNCLQGPSLSTKCINVPNLSFENVSLVKDAKKNIDYKMCSDGMILENREKECSLNHSTEINKSEVLVRHHVALKIPEDVKSSVDQSIQTDELLYDPPTSSSDSSAALNLSKDYIRSQSGRESLDIKRAKGRDFIGHTKDNLKCNHEARHLGSSWKLDGPLLGSPTDFQSSSKDSRFLDSKDFGLLPPVTTGAPPTFSRLDLPDRDELIRWQLNGLAELERKKQEMMNMCLLDAELLYLKKKEKDLKHRLKKVIQRKKALESLKASETRPHLVGDASSAEDRNFPCVNCFDCPKSCDREISCSSRVSHFLLSSKEVQPFECFESSESSSVSNDVELTDGLAPIEVSSDSTHSESRNWEDLSESEPKRNAAFDKLCLLLGPVVKGYIVRRLFKCHEVKVIIGNLMDFAKEELDLFPIINSEDCTYIDQRVYEHLNKQLSSNFNELRQIFIGPPKRRTEILANQRAIEKTFPMEKKLSCALKKRRKKLEEINSFARPVTWASSRAPLASQSDCNVSVNAIPPASVIQSSSSYQIQNLNGFANKAHSNSQLAGSKNTKCSGQDLRIPKFSSFSKKPDLSRNKYEHPNNLKTRLS